MRRAGAGALAALAVSLAAPAAGDAPTASAWALSIEHPDGARHGGIRLLGTVRLSAGEVDGLSLYGLSGLGWDADEGLLYALSDAGRVFHLRPILEDGFLVGVEPVAAFRLRDAAGAPLAGSASDSEGLALRDARNGRRGDARLVVSFERRPRIETFAPDGRHLGAHPLPPDLADPDRYERGNRALESVADVPGIGLVTAPERALAGARTDEVAIVALAGARWRHRLHPLPNPAMVAIEPLPDGGLLLLERGHGFLFLSISNAIRRTAPLVPGRDPQATTLAVIDSARGWNTDNFEGLARHEGLKFFAVSDDNGQAIQRTLLTYFELVEGWHPGESRDFESRQERAR